MMERIVKYFIEEKAVTEVVAKVLSKPLLKYEDIRDEFIYWLDYRNYDAPNTVLINGYSASDVHRIAPFLDAAGIYNFMVTLREDPLKAKEYIDKGFPRK